VLHLTPYDNPKTFKSFSPPEFSLPPSHLTPRRREVLRRKALLAAANGRKHAFNKSYRTIIGYHGTGETTRLQMPTPPAKAAVTKVPSLYNSLSVLAESWAVALTCSLVIAVFSMMKFLLMLN
jgi:hypothetical protein